ncbi:MAG: ABC transporter ATP-binding protein [bacterium]|nr:ABC transporter ATP-binding protein [bacterium]
MNTQVSDNTPMVELCGVGKRFGAMWAVRDVTFAVQPGCVTGLLGPNGCGKTTLLRLCAGLLRPDTGTVRIAGVTQGPEAVVARAQLGMVSADAPLMNELTVAQALELQGILQGLRGAALRAACAHVTEEFALGDFLHRRVQVLSTGMRQRAAIASAMMHAPRVLLLDEPTVGLDPDVRAHLWNCLRALAARGVALLLSTHYLEEVVRVCDWAHLLVRGTLSLSMNVRAMEGSVTALEQAFFAALLQEQSPCEQVCTSGSR